MSDETLIEAMARGITASMGHNPDEPWGHDDGSTSPAWWWQLSEARAALAEIRKTHAVVQSDALARLLTSAAMLLQNAEGCAVNHYGEDFSIHGMPGWLADCSADIAAVRALTASESTNVR